ncbi:hypothetical protein SLS55_001738 [Diplodia seriata]|uniref:Kinesin light chain n=1 Tax=Diplodia seriata TaxID=420778 RepID=A0ABR3CQ59_9PEZI
MFDIPDRGPCETVQMILNSGQLASLWLLLGDTKNADTKASNAVHECKKLLDTQRLELDTLETQQRNLQSTEQRPAIQNEKHQYRQDDVHSLNPRSNMISTENEVVAKKIVHLKGRIENTRKALLECEFRLVKTRTELGYIDEAFEKNEDILHQMRMVWGPNHVVTLRASNFHSKLLLLREEYSEAEATCKNSLRYMTDHLGSEHYFTLDFVGTLVKIYLTQGRWKEAHDIAESLVVRNRSAIGENHPQTLESEVDLAYLLDLVGDTVTAEKFQRSVHEKCEKILGQHHHTTLISRSRLASVNFNAGSFSDAERQVRDVSEYLDSKKTTGDNRGTFSVATANKVIASVARRLASRYRTEASSKEDPESRKEAKGHSDELFKISEDHIGEAVKFHAGALQKDHAEILIGRFEQYLIKRDKEERVDDRLLRDLHDILIRRRPRSGSSHPEIAAMQHELSLSYASIGGWEDARRLGIAALEARLQAFDTSHPDVLRSRLQLAPILWCVGQMEEAIKQLVRAHDTISQSPSSFPAFDLLSIKGNLANVLAEVGEDEKAAKLQEQLVSESKGKSNHLATRNDLAFIYQKSGRFKEAEHEYDEIERELDNRCSITSTKRDLFDMIVKSNRASLHMKKAEYAHAEKLQREVKRNLKLHPAYGELNRDTITCRYNLALILKMKGEDKKAENQLRKALENMERLAGKDHVESKDMKAKLQEWAKSSAGKKPRAHMQKALSGRHRRDSGCVAPD